MTLGSAVRAFWPRLLVVTLFPTVMAVADVFPGVPPELSGAVFVVVCFWATAPWYARKAPYAFVAVVTALAPIGGAIAYAVVTAFRFFTD